MAIRETFVRTPYNYDVDQASLDSGLVIVEETMTIQSSIEECDINTIIERFGLGYRMPESNRIPMYGDFDGIDSYQEALAALRQAGESFDALPAKVRRRFGNDPAEFVEFMMNDANRDEAVALGLVPEKVTALPLREQPQPDKAPVPVAVPPVPASPPSGV